MPLAQAVYTDGISPAMSSTSGSSTANVQIWRIWNNTACSGTVSTAGNFDVWPLWIQNGTTATCTVTGSSTIQVWDAWTTKLNMTKEQQARHAQDMVRRQEEQRVWAAEAAARRIQVEGEQKLARERAAKLLNESLSEPQRLELADKGYFSLQTIDSKSGQRRSYQVSKGRSGNVYEVDDSGKRIASFCCHPIIACPDEDTMLSQKLYLENLEEEFRRTANRRQLA